MFRPTVRTVARLSGLVILATGMAPAQTLDLAVSFREDTAHASISPRDHEVAARDTTPAWQTDLAAMTALLPANANLDALDYGGASAIFFSLGENVMLGGNEYADEDVIFWNGSSFAMAFDGSSAGLPASADLDALDVLTASPFEATLSLDRDCFINVAGVITLVADEDAVRYITGAAPSPFTAIDFDGSAEGVPAPADLDGLSRGTSGQLLVSFDSAGLIAGGFITGGSPLAYDDADILEWGPGTGLFTATPWFTSAAAGFAGNADLDAIEANSSDLNPIPNRARNWLLFE